MNSVDAISRTDAWAVGGIEHGKTPVNSPYVPHWNGAKWSAVTIPGSGGYPSTQVSASSAGNVWGAASAETNANSSVDHPAMVIYGPLP